MHSRHGCSGPHPLFVFSLIVHPSQPFHHLLLSLVSVHASRLSWILNSLLFLLSRSLLELVPSRSSFQLARHLHPSTTFRFDRDTRRCQHVVLKFLSLCPHMLDIVLSARTFPHLSWSHRILSLQCLSLEFSWFGCRRPHLHLPLMQALKMRRRI